MPGLPRRSRSRLVSWALRFFTSVIERFLSFRAALLVGAVGLGHRALRGLRAAAPLLCVARRGAALIGAVLPAAAAGGLARPLQGHCRLHGWGMPMEQAAAAPVPLSAPPFERLAVSLARLVALSLEADQFLVLLGPQRRQLALDRLALVLQLFSFGRVPLARLLEGRLRRIDLVAPGRRLGLG